MRALRALCRALRRVWRARCREVVEYSEWSEPHECQAGPGMMYTARVRYLRSNWRRKPNV